MYYTKALGICQGYITALETACVNGATEAFRILCVFFSAIYGVFSMKTNKITIYAGLVTRKQEKQGDSLYVIPKNSALESFVALSLPAQKDKNLCKSTF